jgi:hypothetical protein
MNKEKKKGKIRKVLKYVFAVLFILIVWDTVPSFFYKPEKNGNPLQSFYKKGVYHVHSVFSDGKGTIDDITRAAGELSLDFVVLTDHGRPNVKASKATAWMHNVLLIGASELSLNCGHLSVQGFKTPDYIFPPEPQESINEVVLDNENGSCYISHPFDSHIPWTDWDIDGFTGLEVFSSYSEARKAGLLKVLMFPHKYLINSKYALLNTMNYPRQNMNKWDALNEHANMRTQFYGIYALDAHARLPLSKKFHLNFPTYKSMFEVLTVYVKIDGGFDSDTHAAADLVFAALKRGRFFNAVEAIAPANGFDVFFVDDADGKRLEMGGVSSSFKGKIVLLLPFQFGTTIRLFQDGDIFEQRTNEDKKQVEIKINKPGVYRLEVYVKDNTFDDLPWIMTNPFFLGMKPPPLDDSDLIMEANVMANKKPLLNDGEQFKVEKNNGSTGVLEYAETGPEGKESESMIRLRFNLAKDSPDSRDFWSVLALRRSIDLSEKKGFAFETWSSKRLRYWLEFRTGDGKEEEETWYRHSFLAYPGWSKVRIPFDKFHPYFGAKRKADMKNIRSIFIGINNQSAYEGTAGELYLNDISIY